jgi:DNA adenine methylase
MTPLLRWVGSKRRLAPTIGPRLLAALAAGGRYFEPFLGSGALFLWLREQGWRGEAVLSDACAPLIETYRAIFSRPAAVADWLEHFEREARKGINALEAERYYNEVKTSLNLDICTVPLGGSHLAACVIWVNRRCFNGLWRTDARGNFNVAWGGPGRKTPMPSAEELEAFGAELRGADLRSGDFAAVVREAGRGDVVYTDPPYNGVYKGYSAPFGPREQGALVEALKGAVARGAFVVASNADTPYVRALYTWASVEELDLTSLVGGKAGRRPAAKELLITAGGRLGC